MKYATYKIEINVGHEYTDSEEEAAHRVLDLALGDLLNELNDYLPDGWTAREAS